MTKRLGVVGTPIYPSQLDPAAGDVRTWAGIAPYFRDITVIARTEGLRPRKERVGNVRYIFIPRLPRPFDLVAFPVAASLLAFFYYLRGVRTWSFSDPLRSGLVCLAMRPLPGVRLIVQVQGQLLRMPSNRFGKATPIVEKWTALVARRADTVRAVSREIARAARAAGVRPERIVVVPNRCDTTLFDPDHWREAGQAMRASFSDETGSVVVGFVGSLNASKGIDVLVEGCAIAAENRPLKLAVAGDGPLRKELETAALRHRVPLFLLGRLPPQDVPRFLAAIDILAAPSYDEGLPRAVLEGMAMRVPVVASNVGGIPDAVQHGINGLLVPSGDARVLAESLNRVIDDPDLAERLGIAARKRILQEFDAPSGWRRMASIHGAPSEGTHGPVG